MYFCRHKALEKETRKVNYALKALRRQSNRADVVGAKKVWLFLCVALSLFIVIWQHIDEFKMFDGILGVDKHI